MHNPVQHTGTISSYSTCSFKQFTTFLPQQHSLPGAGPRYPRPYTPGSSLCCGPSPVAARSWHRQHLGRCSQHVRVWYLKPGEAQDRYCMDCSCTTAAWSHQQSGSGIWCRANCITSIPEQREEQWACLNGDLLMLNPSLRLITASRHILVLTPPRLWQQQKKIQKCSLPYKAQSTTDSSSAPQS